MERFASPWRSSNKGKWFCKPHYHYQRGYVYCNGQPSRSSGESVSVGKDEPGLVRSHPDCNGQSKGSAAAPKGRGRLDTLLT